GCKVAVCGDLFRHITGTPPFEQCDDGNTSNADDCVAGCRNFACGDGFRHTTGKDPLEECDDGNTAAGDACSHPCKNVEFAGGINNTTNQVAPTVAVAKGGSFVIAWGTGAKLGGAVRARAFASNGVAKTGEILLAGSALATSQDADASVAADGLAFL